MRIQSNLLLRIISGVGKKPRINTPLNSINTLDDNSIDIGMNEVIIKNFAPDGMHKFTAAV
jgi:hypothetical protein